MHLAGPADAGTGAGLDASSKLEDTRPAPSPEAHPDAVPLAIVGRQSAPGDVVNGKVERLAGTGDHLARACRQRTVPPRTPPALMSSLIPSSASACPASRCRSRSGCRDLLNAQMHQCPADLRRIRAIRWTDGLRCAKVVHCSALRSQEGRCRTALRSPAHRPFGGKADHLA